MKKMFLTVCLSLLATTAAALTTIYDSGNTIPIQSYLPKPAEKKTMPPKDWKPFQLPITTPSMQVGDVQATQKTLRHLSRPLFLIGSDSRSKQWLQTHKENLIAIGAIGLLIEVADQAEIDATLKLAHGLQIVPASAESFAVKLGLTHYPVLLSKEGWEQ